MANQNIKLEKTIISNRESNSQHDKTFNKLAKSDIEINESKILDIYDAVFYNTPKTGTYSHTSIVQRIHDYVHAPLNRSLDSKIEQLSDDLIVKNEELDNKQSPDSIRQHPVYENGSFLIAGEGGEKYPGLDTIYVMQEGYKRPIDNTSIYQSIRKCFDLPFTGSLIYSGLYYVPLLELNTIDEGKRITTTGDLNIIGKDLDVDDTVIKANYSSYLMEFECVGLEIEDATDQLIANPDAQFYLDGGCFIQHTLSNFSDPYQQKTVDLNLGTSNVSLSKGEKRIVRIGRNNDLQPTIDGVPDNVNYNIVNVQYNGNNVQDYVRQWGPGTKYEGILEVTGKVNYRELGIDNTIHEEKGNFKKLNGLPSSFIISSNALGSETSQYGTRMIYPGGSGFYGDQFHEDHLQQEVFNDPHSAYYKPVFYGQPIFRYDSDFLILLGHNTENDKLYFLSLEKKEDRRNQYASGIPGSRIWDFNHGGTAGGLYIVNFRENKLKEKDEGLHVCPLAINKNKLGWKSGDWNTKRLRYKGFKDVGTFGFETTSNAPQIEMGEPNPSGKNALEYGFFYPQYLTFANGPSQWTPWN